MTALPRYSLYAFLLATCCLLLPACATRSKLPQPGPGSRPCDASLGEYFLGYPNSVLVMPYENKRQVVFVDSMGRLDTFQIKFIRKRRQPWTQYLYTGIATGDTLKYCYERQYYQCILESRASNLKFILDVAAMPRCLLEKRVCADEASKQRVDVLSIWCTGGNTDSRYSFQVFQKIVNPPADYAVPGVREWYPEKELLGRVFKNVASMAYLLDKPAAPVFRSRLFYNTTEGLVAFSTNDGPLWRLAGVDN